MAMRLFLIDLDGTLVSTGGAGLRSLARTFKDLYGITGSVEKVDPSGKTDPAIFREILKVAFGRDPRPGEIETIAESYLAHLLNDADRSAQTKTLDGVLEFLRVVSRTKHCLSGLGTGNLERGARIKLEPTGLNEYFPFGGFGSDAERRSEVLKIGHRRAEAHAGYKILNDDVFVIGDTCLDIAAAKEAGFRSVAVASGSHSAEALKKSSPDYFFTTLAGAERVLAATDGRIL